MLYVRLYLYSLYLRYSLFFCKFIISFHIFSFNTPVLFGTLSVVFGKKILLLHSFIHQIYLLQQIPEHALLACHQFCLHGHSLYELRSFLSVRSAP